MRSPSRNPLVVVAHDVQDPGNVGGIMRTAEAAGATAFVATAVDRGSARLEGASRIDGQRAAIADRARRDWRKRSQRCERPASTPARSCRAAASRCSSVDFKAPIALILGGEGAGCPPISCSRIDRRISIPMQQPVESLNVGVAAALVLYEAFQDQRQS